MKDSDSLKLELLEGGKDSEAQNTDWGTSTISTDTKTRFKLKITSMEEDLQGRFSVASEQSKG